MSSGNLLLFGSPVQDVDPLRFAFAFLYNLPHEFMHLLTSPSFTIAHYMMTLALEEGISGMHGLAIASHRIL